MSLSAAVYALSGAGLVGAGRSGDHVRLKVIAGSHDDFGDENDVAGEIAELAPFLREKSKQVA